MHVFMHFLHLVPPFTPYIIMVKGLYIMPLGQYIYIHAIAS